jgi:phage protein D
MSLIGLHLTLLMGPTVPLPVPEPALEMLDSVEVTHSDEGRSGFQLVFKAVRSRKDFIDYLIFANPQFKAGNRVIIACAFGAIPLVLMDGIITNHQLKPATPGGDPASLTLQGEDVSIMMDLQEKNTEHPAQPDNVIAMKIIITYAQYGLIPLVIPPLTLEVPLPTDRVPVQRATDLAYLQDMAQRHAYTFFVIPGPVIGTNTAYWGPPIRVGIPQRALTVDMGPDSNVDSLQIERTPAEATTVQGSVQDRTTNQRVPILSFLTTRPPLAINNPLLDRALTRTETFGGTSGQTAQQAMSQAQARTDASMDTVKVEGVLNTAKYGLPLMARGLVGLRGAGFSYDGFYYVKKVTHTIKMGDYTQKFTLVREGTGSTVPLVIP